MKQFGKQLKFANLFSIC